MDVFEFGVSWILPLLICAFIFEKTIFVPENEEKDCARGITEQSFSLISKGLLTLFTLLTLGFSVLLGQRKLSEVFLFPFCWLCLKKQPCPLPKK
jgi:hypothetical protein